jgi:Tfp pilus assembly protein PilX
MNTRSQSGQVGLIVLLIMVVMMTISVSVASRSVSELRIARQEEDSSRAFDVAETGIEEALGELNSIAGTLAVGDTHTGSSDIGGTNLSYSVTKLNSLEARVESGQSVEINVAGVSAGAILNVEWSQNQSCPTAPAIEVAIYNEVGGVTQVRREAYTVCDRADGFTLNSITGTDGYGAKVALAMQAGDTIVRLKPLYAHSMIRVISEGNWLPEQSFVIASVGQNTVGKETRAVEVTRSLPAAPSVFDYVLFSGGTLTK